MSTEHLSENPDEGLDLWRDFILVSDGEEVLFDPLADTVSSYEEQGRRLPDGFESWEDLFLTSPSALAYDLIGSASQISTEHLITHREQLLVAALQISETLPSRNPEDHFSTRGSVLEAIFWHRFTRKEYEECTAIIEDVIDYCGDEAYSMYDALENPVLYHERLEQRTAQDD